MSATTPACKWTQTQSLDLTLKPSLLYCGYIFLCHALAMSGVWLSGLSLIWQLASSFLLAPLCVWYLWRYWCTYPRQLSWRPGRWRIDGVKADLRRDLSLYPYLINLRFSYRDKSLALIILPDNVAAEGSPIAAKEWLRRLRFVLINLAQSGKAASALKP
ncbi:hypothetical protein [Maricurvus nonylphenolicus]|uniref:hypothetical protein n=1 Tax=Maricurvus nonylphenolicus TaxID=1008307 RepID=UPI0036F2885C